MTPPTDARLGRRPRRLALIVITMMALSAACTVIAPNSDSPTPTPAAAASFHAPGPAKKMGPPPAGTMYHGVNPGGPNGEEDDQKPEDLRAYTDAAGKPAAWMYFSNNWFRDRAFPTQMATWTRDAGAVPFVRLMLRSDLDLDHAEPTFTLERIVAGQFDADLRAWADQARDFGSPVVVEFGTEVNGKWFSWNGFWHGSNAKGPELFRNAYRHIITITREQGCRNLTWAFHIAAGDDPQTDWNRFENYYPGNEWIDWLGISAYGAESTTAEWTSFREQMDDVYPRLTAMAPDKPVMVLEFGTIANHPTGDQAAWTRDALTDLTSHRWPKVAGFSWWNERWENEDGTVSNMKIQESPATAAAFRQVIQNSPSVVSTPTLID